MSQGLMSPFSLFTLDSLVTLAQWTAARPGKRHTPTKNAIRKATGRELKTPKIEKPAL